MQAATEATTTKLFRFLKSIPRNTLTLLRMIFIDCAVPIVFLFIFNVFGQLVAALCGTILTAWSIDPVVVRRAKHAINTLFAQSPLLVVYLQRRQPIRQSFRSPRSIIAAVTIGTLLLAINVLAQVGKSDVGLEFSLSAGLMVLSICLFTPIAEEMFFRGYLWARLQARGYGDGLITICTALLFAAVHWPNNLAALTNYLFMAFSFSLIRYFGGGIGLPIFFHAAMNFIVIRHIGV